MMHSGYCVGASKRRDEQTKFIYVATEQHKFDELLHSSFELLLLDTWPSACYQRVDVLSQLYLILRSIIIRQLLTCRGPVNDLGDSRTAKMIPGS